MAEERVQRRLIAIFVADVVGLLAARCDEGEVPECPVIDAVFQPAR